MSSRSPRSIRCDAGVDTALSQFVARHPGTSASSVTNRLVDEGLRMAEHPGVLFRDSGSGRRAVLVGGPDVRDVIRAVRSAREAEPELDPAAVLALVETNTGVSKRLIDIALNYWSSYPAEVDAWLDDIDQLENLALEAAARRHAALAMVDDRTLVGLPDPDVLAHAAQERRVLVAPTSPTARSCREIGRQRSRRMGASSM